MDVPIPILGWLPSSLQEWMGCGNTVNCQTQLVRVFFLIRQTLSILITCKVNAYIGFLLVLELFLGKVENFQKIVLMNFYRKVTLQSP